MNFVVSRVEKNARNRMVYFAEPQDLKITYFGNGNGFESVKVNDKTVNLIFSKLWYVKILPFMLTIGNDKFPAFIEVSVHWFKIKRLRIVVGNQIAYTEGSFEIPPVPAQIVEEKDFSAFDKKPSPRAAYVFLVVMFITLLLIPYFRIENEWSRPYWDVFKFAGIPLLLTSLFIVIKRPKILNSLGPLYSVSTKAVKFLTVLSLMILFVGIVGSALSGINARLRPGIPTIVKGTLRGSFESNYRMIATIETTARQLKIPVDLCLGRSAEVGDQIEVGKLEGILGIYYSPSTQREKENLDIYLVENVEDGKWLREENFSTAARLKGRAWTIAYFSKWSERCRASDYVGCRLASYAAKITDLSKQKWFLEKSCEGKDPVGCYGLMVLPDAKIDEKKVFAEKIFQICKFHQPTCRCYWDEFKKYVDSNVLNARKSELCGNKQKWACDL